MSRDVSQILTAVFDVADVSGTCCVQSAFFYRSASYHTRFHDLSRDMAVAIGPVWPTVLGMPCSSGPGGHGTWHLQGYKLPGLLSMIVTPLAPESYTL
jgi:hypothetical protein